MSTEETAEIAIVDLPERSQFALVDGKKIIGKAAYLQHAGRRIFYHTVVSEDYAGRGLAGALVSTALDETFAAGLVVVPVCPYVVSWLERHPDYAQRTQQPDASDLEALRSLG